MCLAIPGVIKEIQGDQALVDYGGVLRSAGLRLFPEAGVGDTVLVHAGFIIQKLSDDDGAELQKLIEETLRETAV